MGYEGSLPTLRRFMRTLKAPEQRARRVTLRYETPPGQQAQADWAFCGSFALPCSTKPLSIMVLSFSRLMSISFTNSMKLASLIQCHQAAFEFFGGWPATILYDNMKQVRFSRSQWNEAFLDFCRHYSFAPTTHRPYRPRTKGKVERMVDHFNVCRSRTLALSPGDRIQLKANSVTHDGSKLANGEVVTVDEIKPNEAIRLVDGRVLPANYRRFFRGYAVTSYASQGKTVDHVLFSDSAIRAATNAQQWYVTISRGRKSIKIFTPDKEQLRHAILRTGEPFRPRQRAGSVKPRAPVCGGKIRPRITPLSLPAPHNCIVE
jgi:hypothetical protein